MTVNSINLLRLNYYYYCVDGNKLKKTGLTMCDYFFISTKSAFIERIKCFHNTSLSFVPDAQI